ncbi:MAG: hypothetical protein KR126chlam3_00905 [Chlamydiae bacterium]|nr:hypothetical protein [Chlamydiota bacterium]
MFATIINFSSNEAPFLRQCLEEVLCFSDQILVCVSDRFFDGTPEDLSLLKGIYASHPNIDFIQYPFSKDNFYGKHSAHFWHNIGRMIGTHFLKAEITNVLFLDADEIVEGKRFRRWLETFPIQDYAALRLSCYWYFREAKYRANEVEDTPLLISKAALHYEALMHPEERAGTFHLAEGKKLRFVEKERPLIHHYSWVRSKEGLFRKVQTWGHKNERNWEELIEEEFSKPFSGRDFVHGYSFEEVEPLHKWHQYDRAEKIAENVTILTTRDIHKIDLHLRFGI